MATRRDQDLPSHPSAALERMRARVWERNVTETDVTQHQSNLAISESDILDGNILARIDANETITGFWDFNADLTVSGVGSQFLGPDGSVAAPTYSFTSDQDTGIMLTATGSLGLVSAGASRMLVQSDRIVSTVQHRAGPGSAAAPIYSFDADPNTGIYRIAENVLGIAVVGTEKLRVDADGLEVSGMTVGANFFTWPSNTGQGAMRLLTDQGGVAMYCDSNMILYAGDTLSTYITNEGIVAGTTSEILHIATDGHVYITPGQQLAYTTATRWQFLDTGHLRTAFDGTGALPAISWIGDPNTGIYRPGGDQIGFSVGGLLTFRVALRTIYLHGQSDTSTAALNMYTTADESEYFHIAARPIAYVTANERETLRVYYYDGVASQFIAAFSWQSGSGQIRVADGSVSSPGYSFAGSVNSGIHLQSGPTLVFATGGTERLQIGTPGLTQTVGQYFHQDGTNSAPAYTFSADSNTGIYRVGADELGITTGGTNRLSVNTARFLLSLAIQGADGNVGAPGYGFSSDPDTGMYRVGVNSLGFTAGGTLRFQVSSTSLLARLRFLGPNEVATTPTYSFENDNDTGMYLPGVGSLGFSVGGAERLRILGAEIRVSTSVQFAIDDGSVLAPGLAFVGDLNTGIHSPGADRLTFVTGGVARGEFEAGGDLVCTGDVVATV